MVELRVACEQGHFDCVSSRGPTRQELWAYAKSKGWVDEEALLAFFRAAFGCPQCDGTGKWRPWEHGEDHNCDDGANRNVIDCIEGDHRCPAEHVEITVFGVTIWADPTKCEWRCEREWTNPSCRNALWKIKDMPWYREADHGHIANEVVGYHSLNYDEAEELAEREARGCGWQPRWDAINQNKETPGV